MQLEIKRANDIKKELYNDFQKQIGKKTKKFDTLKGLSGMELQLAGEIQKKAMQEKD